MKIINRIYIALSRRVWYSINKPKFKKLGDKSFIKKALIITPSCIEIKNNVFIQPN